MTLQFASNPVIAMWWKSLLIMQSEPRDSCLKSIVLRLGGLHTDMSFLGSIGHLMVGSGLQELLEVVYTSNAVKKQLQELFLAHLLVDAALNTILVANAYNIPLYRRAAERPTDLVPPEEGSEDTDE